jgi:NAD(P)-dependent dehydrogenase (short-subunit alcohol dehydrogenase family)
MTTRVCMVTGGSRGLGRAMVRGLLKDGHKVACVDHDQASLDELAKEEASRGADFIAVRADLSQESGCADALAAVEACFGQVDVLVNNAGIGQPSIRPDHWVNPIPFWEVTPAQWGRFFAVNTTAGFLLARAVAPGMVQRGWGRIVGITTSLDSMLRAGNTPYGATKAATEAFTTVMAADLAGTGVTANIIVPGGLTNTALVNDTVPYDRATMLQPEVMVAPLLWLVSEAANAVSSRRYIGAKWDPAMPADAAEAQAGAPAAWAALGKQMIPMQK